MQSYQADAILLRAFILGSPAQTAFSYTVNINFFIPFYQIKGSPVSDRKQ